MPENDPATLSDMAFDAATLTARKIVSLVAASEELVMDGTNIGAVLRDAMAFSLSSEIDRLCLFGSGEGQPYGLLVDPSISATTLTGDITINAFLDAYYAILGQNVDPMKVSALFNADVAKTIAKLKDATSGLYLEASAPQAWKDLKKFITNQIPTTEGATSVALGDFSNYLLGVRQGITIELNKGSYESLEGTKSAFQRSQILFRATMRADGVPVRANAFHRILAAGV